ncbi:MAG TPA: hypothetical protein QGI62_08850 [Anaerolineales bacterium]|nr:hypothetical protein [Anaerolineales bacterium]
MEGFNRTVLDEFFRTAFLTNLPRQGARTGFEAVEALQEDLDIWLEYYKTGQLHQDYGNL